MGDVSPAKSAIPSRRVLHRDLWGLMIQKSIKGIIDVRYRRKRGSVLFQYALPTLLKRIDEQYMYCLLINYTSGCQPIRMAVIYIATLAGGE